MIKRIICMGCAAVMLFSLTACGKKQAEVSVTPANSMMLSDPGHLTSEGYELPYTYDDGYKAVIEVVGNSEYVTANKTPGGNMVFHLTTDKTEKEVLDFYDAYFAKLQKVKAKAQGDNSTGYFDKDKRLIIYNLYVWTANGKTNYKMAAEACEKLADSQLFEAVAADKTETTAADTKTK